MPGQGFASRRLPQLAGGPLPRLEAVTATASSRNLRRGETLCDPGESFPYLVLIERGVLVKSVVVRDGREATVCFLEPGEVSGSLSLLFDEASQGRPVDALESDGTHAYRVSAITDARVELLDAGLIGDLALRYREWATLRSLLLLERARTQALGEAERLTRTPEERYEALVARSPNLVARLTQRDIARYLGISEVTMSRMKARRNGREEAPGSPSGTVRVER